MLGWKNSPNQLWLQCMGISAWISFLISFWHTLTGSHWQFKVFQISPAHNHPGYLCLSFNVILKPKSHIELMNITSDFTQSKPLIFCLLIWESRSSLWFKILISRIFRTHSLWKYCPEQIFMCQNQRNCMTDLRSVWKVLLSCLTGCCPESTRGISAHRFTKYPH